MSSQRSFKLALIPLALMLGACSFSLQAGTSAGTNNQQGRRAAQPNRRVSTPPRTNTPKPANTISTPTKPAVEAPRINGKNAFGNGSLGAFKGSAYVIPNTTQRMPDLSKMVPFATLFTDSFIVQPQEFTGGFPGVLMQEEWFAIRYEGRFNIQADNTYIFRLISDDGAVLYIDGEKVVDNDGIHASKTATGNKMLRAGQHSLRLDYFQGARGPVSLSLAVSDAATEPRPLVGIR